MISTQNSTVDSILEDKTSSIISISQQIHNIQGITLQDKLVTLNRCNCCTRHTTNKPTTFLPSFILLPNSNSKYNYCTCNCRHLSRWICRMSD